MSILLIVASGKSSRFGGFPKAFCDIGNKMNVDNTILHAREVFEKVYIGVNNAVYLEYKSRVRGCEMFSIKTGQGDAHSLLKCLAYIKEHEKTIEQIVVCWGDAIFVDSTPFQQLVERARNVKIAVACSYDVKPYAWFDIDSKNGIVKSHFAREDGFVEKGLHDQSLFLFDFNFVWKYLNEYRERLGIPYDNDENTADVNEMKLLHFFEYLFKADYELAKCVEITSGKVLSFNTQEELEEIKEKIKSNAVEVNRDV